MAGKGEETGKRPDEGSLFSKPWQQLLLLVGFVAILAFFFAEVEIQIEGSEGWAASLPTWKIEKHWLLDIFWGGRPMTGYHAWVFSFIFLVFHLPIFILAKWTWRLELKILAGIQIFWLIEDFLWFVLNPAFGIDKFTREIVWWHKNWFWFMPVDYWTFIFVSSACLYFAFFFRKQNKSENQISKPETNLTEK